MRASHGLGLGYAIENRNWPLRLGFWRAIRMVAEGMWNVVEWHVMRGGGGWCVREMQGGDGV